MKTFSICALSFLLFLALVDNKSLEYQNKIQGEVFETKITDTLNFCHRECERRVQGIISNKPIKK